MKRHRRNIEFPSASALALVVLAVLIRVYGIGWSLPHVYEEAQPLRQAWEMWGWGAEDDFDPNPHFFNYPSLTFYLQLGGQAALYGAMHAGGTIDDSIDFRARYVTDPTPFYLLGRLLNVLMAAITVLMTYALGRRVGGPGVGAVASFLLAVNVFHVSRSQMIEVDIPLACFATTALVAILAALSRPSRRAFAIAGIAVGVATATKYTGALLVVPLAVAYLHARRATAARLSWLLSAFGLAAAVFVACSPYVVLDFSAFLTDLNAERAHMRLGHFGVADRPAWLFYGVRLGQALLGWPAFILGAAGLAMAVWRRHAGLVVMGSFVVAYFAAISSWNMMADRYALPLLPLMLVFAAWSIAETLRTRGVGARARGWSLAAFALVLALPQAMRVPDHMARFETDSRTVALGWIRDNVPPGSFIVTEAYGPPLFGPLDYWAVDGSARSRIDDFYRESGFYSVMPVPMFQTEPERSEVFYDMSLYRMADVFVSSGSVSSRYRKDPDRFARHVAFYDSIAARFDLAVRIPPQGEGPEIRVYRNSEHGRPFASRPPIHPPDLSPAVSIPPGLHASYYYRMGLNHEAFGHLGAAMSAYTRGLPYSVHDPEVFQQISYAMVRTYALMGDREAAFRFLDEARLYAPTARDRRFVDGLVDIMRRRAGDDR